MGKQEELTKLERNLKDAENRLKTFGAAVDTIQKEIDYLTNLENQLQENVSYLKNVKVVALASEYKKAKEDLKKTKVRLGQLKSDKSVNEKAVKDIGTYIDKNREAYDKLAKQDDNNVLQGKFGRRRG